MKKQTTNWEEIVTIHLSDNGLYPEHTHCYTQKVRKRYSNVFKEGANNLNKHVIGSYRNDQ